MNASELIDLFGGTAETSRKFGVGQSAVSNWRNLGFPARLHYRIAKEAAAAGIILPGDFFDGNTDAGDDGSNEDPAPDSVKDVA